MADVRIPTQLVTAFRGVGMRRLDRVSRRGIQQASTIVAAVSAVFIGAQLTLATARADLHNVTYIARVDGVAPGSTATFLINDNQTSTTNLSSLPGNSFEANTVLADPSKAGLQVAVRWPYSANVHCEIDVDDNVATQLDQVVKPTQNNDPSNGVLACGAPLPPS